MLVFSCVFLRCPCERLAHFVPLLFGLVFVGLTLYGPCECIVWFGHHCMLVLSSLGLLLFGHPSWLVSFCFVCSCLVWSEIVFSCLVHVIVSFVCCLVLLIVLSSLVVVLYSSL